MDALGPHELAGMCNTELLTLKRELAERSDSGALDGYGYYL